MKRMTGWLLAAAVAVWALTSAVTVAEEADVSIKDVMAKANKPGGLVSKIGKSLKGGDWDAVTADAKELVPLAEALAKNEPPKGDKASWEKLCGAYTENAKKLLAAAEKKDAKAAMAAQGALAKSCGGCHKTHK
jgi:cytochrome c556